VKTPKKKTTPKKKARAVPASKKKARATAKRAIAKAPAKPKRKSLLKAKPKPKPTVKATAKPKAASRPKTAAKAKAVAKVKAATKPKPAAKRKPLPEAKRRDATGHLNPKYAAELRERSVESAEPREPASFVKGSKSGDPLAEEMGEEFVKTVVSGEDTQEDTLDQVVPEEGGGPFVQTTGGTEFAEGTDPSNPESAEREPFPTT
jgi:hypothetical protein